ncbi:hypothetical protein CXZ13_09850 [Lactiplantibacillus plantarum]|nr:hypothetical protein CEF05_05085 [Lactiplantibacillus plantarum]AUH37559.1 hypothetical protein CXZ13_09850 [Lactiplantibacillus plantarum]AXI13087.1 hypothetical protein C6I22_10140 [Lactiplantibacillus plantarum]KOE71471.1 hypothetical protein AB662_13205 [Lactiplantibacillus plantarum]MCT3261347.1 hypothetical protein [Lactiplantibacillus plantarum]
MTTATSWFLVGIMMQVVVMVLRRVTRNGQQKWCLGRNCRVINQKFETKTLVSLVIFGIIAKNSYRK